MANTRLAGLVQRRSRLSQLGKIGISASLLAGLLAALAACPGSATNTHTRTTQARGAPPPPSVELRSFNGRRGVFRIHNRSRHTLTRIAIGLRGVGCEGPKPTRTTVKVFDLKLRPGERQSFAFNFDYKCRRAHVAVATQ